MPYPLQVGVSNGNIPVENATVRFTVVAGGGGVTMPIATTDANGIASTLWKLGAEGFLSQVMAELIDVNGQRVHLPIIFNAQFASVSGPTTQGGLCTITVGDGYHSHGDYNGVDGRSNRIASRSRLCV